MNRKHSKYRHIIVLESRRGRVMTEIPEPAQHETIPRRSTERPFSRGQLPEDTETTLPPYARRKFRGWIETKFNVRHVQRLIPVKSDNFRLRFRNLNYKRKWNLVWC